MATVFICHAKEDNQWVDGLEKHLRGGGIQNWSDKELGWGQRWDQEIDGVIATCAAAILLISVDFLCSQYIKNRELPALMKRQQDERLPLLPVLARECYFEHIRLLHETQFFKPDAVRKPLEKLSDSERSAHLTAIVRKLREILLPSERALGSTAEEVGGSAAGPRKQSFRGCLPPLLSTDRFIGHQAKYDQVAGAVLENALVTITGPPGVGKSALARAVLDHASLRDQFHDQIARVELERVITETPQTVAAAIIQQLRPADHVEGARHTTINVADDGPEVKNGVDRLVQMLIGRPVLLLLDNCDHAIKGATLLYESLRLRTRELHLIVTCRQHPGDSIEGAEIIRHEPMSLPCADSGLEEFHATESVQLFVYYAGKNGGPCAIDNGGKVFVSRILGATSGLPLAIRLIAARRRRMGLRELEDGMAGILNGRHATNADTKRQNSLEASIEWSFSRLSKKAQSLFELLSLFRAPFTREQAIRVALGPEGNPSGLNRSQAEGALDEVVSASLAELQDGRYCLLGPLRTYGDGRLQGKGRKNACKRYADCFTEFSGNDPKLQLRLTGPFDQENRYQAGLYAIMWGLNAAGSRLRKKIHGWLESRDRWEEALQFNQGLCDLLATRGCVDLGLPWSCAGIGDAVEHLGRPIEEAIEQYRRGLECLAKVPRTSRIEKYNCDRALSHMARKLSALYMRQGDGQNAERILNEALEGDNAVAAREFRADLLDQLGRCLLSEGRNDEAMKEYEKSRELRTNLSEFDEKSPKKNHSLAYSFRNLGEALQKKHENSAAAAAFETAARYFGEAKDWKQSLVAKAKKAKALSYEGEVNSAEVVFKEVIKERTGRRDLVGAAQTEAELADHYRRCGRIEEAKSCVKNACDALRASGTRANSRALALCLGTAADIHCKAGEWFEAEIASRESLVLLEDLGDRDQVISLDLLSQIYEAQGRTPEALERSNECIKRARSMARPLDLAYALYNAALMRVREWDLDQAGALLDEVERIIEPLRRTSLLADVQAVKRWCRVLARKTDSQWSDEDCLTAKKAIGLVAKCLRGENDLVHATSTYKRMLGQVPMGSKQAEIIGSEMAARCS